MVASLSVLGISCYKIISNDSNSEMWTGMLTFIVGLYIPSPISSFIKYSNRGNAVVQQNIEHVSDEMENV
jgi:hypothetical protein